LPLLLTGCKSNSLQGEDNTKQPNKTVNSVDFQKLYGDINQSYKTFAENIKEDGKLLTQLKEESQKPSSEINNIDKRISTDFSKLTTAIDNFNKQLPDNNKNKLEPLLLLIEIPNNSSNVNNSNQQNNKIRIASIIKLFDDGKLEKTEICEDIQTPLKVQGLNNTNCGNFGENTYKELNQYLTDQIKSIGTEIKTLESNLPDLSNQTNDNSSTNSQNSNNNNQFLILIIINSILGLGVITLFILYYLLIKEIGKENKELKDKNNRRKKQIEDLKTTEANRNIQINKIDAKLKDLKNISDNQSMLIQQLQNQKEKSQFPSNLSDNSPSQATQNNDNANISYTSFEKTTPPPLPENLRLANLYKENPQGLIQNAIRVSMTKETLNKVLAGTWEEIVEFEANNRQGEYYIVANNSGESYLFLDPNTIFNIPTLQNINKSELFICNGNLSQSFKGSEINIIKPAIVKPNNQNWRLIESGEIQLVY